MVARRGAAVLGCVVILLVMIAIGYVSYHVGMPHLERYRFEEQMRQEIRFAGRRSDDEIKARLKAWADSGGYPPEAGKEIGILRAEKRVRIWTDYEHELRLPFFQRTLRFHPSAEAQL